MKRCTIVPKTCSESAANDATDPLLSVIICSGKPTSLVFPTNCANTLRSFSASARCASWFMSMVCTYIPVASAMPRFWFSGLPSPTMAWPGSRIRCDETMPTGAPLASNAALRCVMYHRIPPGRAMPSSGMVLSSSSSKCAVTMLMWGKVMRSSSIWSSFSWFPSEPYTCAQTRWLYLAATRGSMSDSGTPSSLASTRVASAYDAMPRTVRMSVWLRPLAHRQILPRVLWSSARFDESSSSKPS